VITMPETVVYVHTVMIEFLDTLPADHAVEGFDRLDDLAVEAEVLKVYVFIVPNLQHVDHVQLLYHISRLHVCTEEEAGSHSHDNKDGNNI
jgi:hypothetical protein